MLGNKDGYAYIATFIDYLERIFKMLMDLFKGTGSDDAADKKEESEG